MDRSLTARLGRPFFAPAPRRAARRGAGRRSGSPGLLWRPFTMVGGLARTCFLLIERRRRLRIALLSILAALPLLAGGWLWLRDSPLASVEQVRVSGLRGPEARAIDAALAGAARQMSTLDVNTAALRAAVASYPVVRSVRAIPSFPHGLRIEVIEQLPVAALTAGGARTAVAADGVVLGPALLSGSLPALSGFSEPLPGQHVHGPNLLAALTVLGAAPRPLARLAARVFTSPGGQGLTVAMRNGLLVYFGDASRPHAKWLSLARVLADPSSAGASYIDVRLPERPAAGFATTGAPAAGAAATAGQTAGESTVAALAAGLTATTGAGATPVGASTTTEPATTEASPAAAPEAAAATAPTEAASESETPAATPPPGG